MKLSSPVFEDNKFIPSKYTCDGENINPSLKISEVPEEAKSLVLIVDDPDAPIGIWDHWILWDISPSISIIRENSIPKGSVQGENSFGKKSYGGPCPPGGTHRYFFNLYALDKILELSDRTTKKELEKEMKNHILDKTELIGLYRRGL